jgi:apolipoprotein N-acyltransferase
MIDTRRVVLKFAAAAGSGVAFALAFEPYALWPLAGLALVPVLLAMSRAAPAGAFATGLLFGLFHAALSFSWMFLLFGSLTLVLFVVYALQFGIALTLIRTMTKARGELSLLWAAPLVWVSVEWVRSEVIWPKFSWFQAGSALHADLPLLQTADSP